MVIALRIMGHGATAARLVEEENSPANMTTYVHVSSLSAILEHVIPLHKAEIVKKRVKMVERILMVASVVIGIMDTAARKVSLASFDS